jgi:hypothetical protein
MMQLKSIVATFRANPHAHGVLLLLPAIQYGRNYFASVAAVLFTMTLWNTRLRPLVLPTGVALVAASLSLIWNAVQLPDVPYLPREIRLAVGLTLLFWALAGTPRHAVARFDGRWALALLVSLALFATAQWLAGKRGIALYVPQKFFVNSEDWSLAASWVEHAREHGYDWSVRPSAGFSEPSYLGGVSLVLHFVCLHTLTRRQRTVATVLALAVCVVAQTYYGLASNLLVFASFHMRRLPKLLVLSASMAVLCLFALPLFAAESSRLERILSGSDTSTSLRAFQPVELIGYVLAHAPFGVPLTAASSFFLRNDLIAPFVDAPFQNGLLNLLFSYGWFGFGILVLLWRVAGGGSCALFVFLLMAQNGAPLDFDKIAMIVFTVQIVRHARVTRAGNMSGRPPVLAKPRLSNYRVNPVL